MVLAELGRLGLVGLVDLPYFNVRFEDPISKGVDSRCYSDSKYRDPRGYQWNTSQRINNG